MSRSGKLYHLGAHSAVALAGSEFQCDSAGVFRTHQASERARYNKSDFLAGR
jgi:hypothetical protein